MESIEILPNVYTNIELLEGGKNFADVYFDLYKFDDDWHGSREDKYVHITELLGCLLKSRWNIDYDYKPSLEEKGSWFMGSLLHHESQKYRLFRDGYYIIEYPLDVELEDGYHLIGKVDLLHTRESRIEDLKTFIHFFLPYEGNLKDIDIKYLIQPIVYTFIANNTYFIQEQITEIYLVCISKKNVETRIIKVAYTEELGARVYTWLIERVKIFFASELPKGEESKWCEYCQWLKLPCEVGKKYVDLYAEPVNFESSKFKNAFPDKMPYIKREGKWIETKAFKKFKEELKNTKKKNQ